MYSNVKGGILWIRRINPTKTNEDSQNVKFCPLVINQIKTDELIMAKIKRQPIKVKSILELGIPLNIQLKKEEPYVK